MSFEQAFKVTVLLEGAMTNDEHDPGGLTKYGISAANHPTVDIQNLTLEQAATIYRDEYWIPAKCDKLPEKLAHLVFDSAVNQGVTPTIKMLQKALNIQQDGIAGRNTMEAVGKANDVELRALFMAERAMRYMGTRNFDRYGRGWLKRLFIITGASNG